MNLPSQFTEYTRQLLGDAIYTPLAAALESGECPTSIRLNPFKAADYDAAEAVADCVVPWCRDTGRYLKRRPDFTFDPLFHAGMYYVQEAASMFIHHAVRTFIQTPVRMLDLCAAPGGKSTALRAALPEGSVLFSNEPMRTRAQILSENMQKFGHEDVVVTNNYPRDYRKAGLTFDAILADVPCSGEGMFRKDEGAREEWSTQNVENCWRLQREIISDIWDCLKPGGLLFYSTCTFNAHEDEENVAWIAAELGADVMAVPTETEWNITPAVLDTHPACRFMPGISRGEGLFMAVLRKHGESVDETVSQKKADKKKKQKGGRNAAKDNAASLAFDRTPLQCPHDFCQRKLGDAVVAIPSRWADSYDAAASTLKIMHAGVCLGTQKGKDVIPSQALALSRRLAKEDFPRVEVSYAEALSYLRHEAVTLPADAPRGLVLLTYGGIPIGFEKNIGTRANNLYPKEWCIKSSHTPTEELRPIVIERKKQQ
jgi:16S rRNA C967 or C1407 C5-methylase (RsmB/RsmF family)/NOL1/NOP2/fmu family ribosome biogenesis protein